MHMRLLRHLFVTGLSKNGLSRMMAWAAASVERKTEEIRMVHPCIGHQAFDAAAGCELCPVNPCIGHQAWRGVGMLRLRGIVYPRKRAFAPDGVYPERLRALRGNGCDIRHESPLSGAVPCIQGQRRSASRQGGQGGDTFPAMRRWGKARRPDRRPPQP